MGRGPTSHEKKSAVDAYQSEPMSIQSGNDAKTPLLSSLSQVVADREPRSSRDESADAKVSFSMHSAASLSRLSRTESKLSVRIFEESQPGDELFPEMCLTFKGVSCRVNVVDSQSKQEHTKTILRNISGVLRPGVMCALLGPSGSGKSTLLDCISGRKTLEYHGEIQINGHPRDRFFQRVIGYVPQENDVNPNLSVRECLEFCARLKAQHDDESQIEETVNWVIGALSLVDVAEQRVGDTMRRGISGGQRKRVSIGKALVSKPGILFMDEPTSGLSATDALLVMQCIRNISRRNRMSVLCAIHQPRNALFRRFDQLVILAGGECTYNGPLKQSIDYFKSVAPRFAVPPFTNPADHFLDICTLGSETGDPDALIAHFAKHVRPGVERSVDDVPVGTNLRNTLSFRPESEITAPVSRQMYELFWREVKFNARDPQKLVAKAGNAVAMGLLIGAMYYRMDDQYVPNFAYIALAVTSMSPLVSLPSFYADRLMLNLERSQGLYATLPYFVVYTGVSTAISVFFNALFALTTWGMAGLAWDKFGGFFATTLIVFWATDSLILLIAGGCRTIDQAMATFNVTIGIFLLFNGFSANTKTTPSWLSWLCFGSPLYYSLEMTMNLLYAGTDQWEARGGVLGMEEGAYWRDFGICAAMGVGARVAAFFAVKHLYGIRR